MERVGMGADCKKNVEQQLREKNDALAKENEELKAKLADLEAKETTRK